MERVTWTDERLDDLAARMDAGFARVDHELRDLRSTVTRFGIGLVLALIGVIATMAGGFAALLAKGA